MDDKNKLDCSIDDATKDFELSGEQDCDCCNDHSEECDCEHDHDEDSEFAPLLVDLEDEDGNIVSCEVIDSFDYNENQYIIVLNPKDDSNYLFKVVGDEDEPDLIIPEDDEFDEVVKYYDSLVEDLEDDEDDIEDFLIDEDEGDNEDFLVDEDDLNDIEDLDDIEDSDIDE